jgi:hypothetical protein
MEHYYQFFFAFNITTINTLPSYYKYDYSIELKLGIILLFSLLYNMLVKEL